MALSKNSSIISEKVISVLNPRIEQHFNKNRQSKMKLRSLSIFAILSYFV